MKINKRLSIIFAVLFCSFLVCNISYKTSYAFSPANLTKKAVMQALEKCYNSGAVTQSFDSVNAYYGKESLLIDNAGLRDTLPLPSSVDGIYHRVDDDTLRCQDVITGYSGKGGEIEDAFTLMGHPAPAKGAANVDEFLDKYAGYAKAVRTTSAKGKCVKFHFLHTITTITQSSRSSTKVDEYTNQICVDDFTNNKISSAPYIKGTGGWRTYSINGYGGVMKENVLSVNSAGEVTLITGENNNGYSFTKAVITASGKIWEDFVGDIVAAIPNSKLIWEEPCYAYRYSDCEMHSTNFVESITMDSGEAAEDTASYSLFSESGTKAIAGLYGYTGDEHTRSAFARTQYSVSEQEQIHLYMYYLTSVIGAQVNCSIPSEQAIGNGYDGPIKWFVTGTTTANKNCFITSKGNTGKKVNGVVDGKFILANMQYSDLYEYFKNLTVDELKDESTSNTSTNNPIYPDQNTTTSDSNEPEANCYSNSGSLGWVICPVTSGLSDLILDRYEAWIRPALQIDVVLFSQSKDNGTYNAWVIFRDIANIAFILIFLVVIFSQLSGFGIDNYGIKKTLPKIIVGAVLINLSYIICQAAIDVCNVAGNGIGGVFNSITSNIEISSLNIDGTSIGSSTWSSSFASSGWNSVIVVVIAAITTPLILSKGLAILIPVLLLCISVAVSIFILIAILGIRQALAVALVVFSPLAFVCYMIPNLKTNVFNRWLKLFEGVLFAFPICSALIYGGDMVGKILLYAAGNNTWVLLSAAVISVAPIFVIPKAIQGSIGGLSKGMLKLSGGADRLLKGSASKKLNNSFLKNRDNFNSQMRAQRAAARASEYNANRSRQYLKRHEGKSPAEMSAGARRAYFSAKNTVNAHDEEMQKAYAARFASMSDGNNDNDGIRGELIAAANKNKLDENMLIAGLNSINDEDKLTDTFAAISETESYRKLLQNDEVRNRVADSLTSRNNSIINQSLGKLIRVGRSKDENGNELDQSYASIVASGKLGEKIRGSGVNVISSQDKDVFKTNGAADLFSNEQLRAAVGAGFTGDTATAFKGLMDNVDMGRKAEIVSSMKADQLSALTSGENGSLAALGGADFVLQHVDEAAMQTLKSEDGQRLRTNMDPEVMRALGITESHTDNNTGSQVDNVYYPRLEGESEAEYNERIRRNNVIADLARRYPRKPGESAQEWSTRVGLKK